jgi:hydrogenase maturation factor
MTNRLTENELAAFRAGIAQWVVEHARLSRERVDEREARAALRQWSKAYFAKRQGEQASTPLDRPRAAVASDARAA